MAINPEHSANETGDRNVTDLYGDPARFLISDLCRIVEDYMNEEQVREVYQAYLYGAQHHDGQLSLIHI